MRRTPGHVIEELLTHEANALLRLQPDDLVIQLLQQLHIVIVHIGSDDLSKRLQLFDRDFRCSFGDRILQALLELVYYLRNDDLVSLSLGKEGALLR